jgi:4'-phosphopantetheinyl transferase
LINHQHTQLPLDGASDPMPAPAFHSDAKRMSHVEVDVWFWSLDVAASDLAAFTPFLSDDERVRAKRFIRREDRQRWIMARGRMRQILGLATGLAPEVLIFGAEAHGRPVLINPTEALSFNLSHSANIAALAVSKHARVGVDVEFIRPLADDEMSWPLSDAENDALDRFEGQAKRDAFFCFWTRKEAFIKAVGAGVSIPLGDFDVSAPGDGEPRLLRVANETQSVSDWRFAETRPVRGCLCALAVLAEGRSVEVVWRGMD